MYWYDIIWLDLIHSTAFHLIADIKTEAVETRAEVKSFDQSTLKHVKTEEKNPLPDAKSKLDST